MSFLERVQREFTPERMTKENLEDWLIIGPKGEHEISKGKGGRKIVEGVMKPSTRAKISEIASRLSEVEEISREISSIKSLASLNKVEPQITQSISQLPVYQERLRQSFESASTPIIEREVARQEKEINIRESLKVEASDALTADEARDARRQLRDIAPQVLGGIRSGESRRARIGLSYLDSFS